MAILQVLVAAVVRSAGKLLNLAFGWATVMLFGKVPQDRQLYLSAIAFGSVIWLVALVAIVVPAVGTLLLTFAAPPPWLDRNWIRAGMVALVVVLPAIVGWLSTRMVADEERPRGRRATMAAVARGYPYTLGLALTLLMLTVLAPVQKARNLRRRWTAQHVPVIIKPEHYPEVLDDVQDALEQGGLATTRQPAGWRLRLPTRVLAVFARRPLADLMAERLTRLVASQAEILVHPTDLVISGRPRDAARARAVLSEHLTYTRAYLTWSKAANDLEDRIRDFWPALQAAEIGEARALLDEVVNRLGALALPYEEWEVLFRQTLLAERALRRDAGPITRRRVAAGLVTTLLAAAPVVEQATEVVEEFQRLLGGRPKPRRALDRLKRALKRAA